MNMAIDGVDSDVGETPEANDQHADQQQFIPPSDGSWIPRDRLNSEIEKRKAVEVELQQMRDASQKPELTRAQLDMAVEAGEITEADRDTYLEEQMEARLSDRITTRIADKENERRVQAQLDEYGDAVPDIAKQGSDIQTRIAAEYNDLVSYGYDNDDPKTALAAVKAVLGPLSALKAGKAKPKVPDTHQDVPGGGGEEEESGSGKVKWNDLDARQKAYYDNAISRGAYPSREAALKELSSYGRR